MACAPLHAEPTAHPETAHHIAHPASLFLPMHVRQTLRQVLTNLPRPYKQACAMGADAGLLLAAFCVAVWLRFDTIFISLDYFMLACVACLGGVGALYVLGLYRHILRHMNERVVLLAVGGVVFSVALVISVNAFLRPGLGLSRAFLAIYGLLALGSLLGMRMLARHMLFQDVRKIADAPIPVLIYGAGSAGLQLASALRHSPHYRPVALMDDDARKHRLMMAGLKIYPPSRLSALIGRYQIQQLLIAMPTAPRSRIRNIIDTAQQHRMRVRLVPSMKEMVDTRHGLRLRDLNVEDLLGRDPVVPVPTLLQRCVTGRAILVTGAGGSIGSELCRQILCLEPARLVLVDVSEPALYAITQELAALNARGIPIASVLGSVRDQAHCLRQIQRFGIQTVYHAAAYKHVPIVEDNIAEGIRTNAFGTHALAQAAIAGGVKDFVLISTDKAVRPTNVMGASKRLAELVLQGCAQTQDATRFSMVRFGNVLGSSGSVVPLFHKQILAGGPITLTHPEITRYFMTIPEAAALVLQAGAMGESGSVYLLDMGESVRIQDLAIKMVHLYGLTLRDQDNPDGDIEIRITGLRPGEKLYEELLIDADTLATEHPKIMKARERFLPYATLCEGLAELESTLTDDDTHRTLTVLRRLVPEYVSATQP